MELERLFEEVLKEGQEEELRDCFNNLQSMLEKEFGHIDEERMYEMFCDNNPGSSYKTADWFFGQLPNEINFVVEPDEYDGVYREYSDIKRA